MLFAFLWCHFQPVGSTLSFFLGGWEDKLISSAVLGAICKQINVQLVDCSSIFSEFWMQLSVLLPPPLPYVLWHLKKVSEILTACYHLGKKKNRRSSCS